MYRDIQKNAGRVATRIGSCMFACLLALTAHAAVAKAPFKVYSSLSFSNKPQGLEQCGLTPLPLLTPWYFFAGSNVANTLDGAYLARRLPQIREVLSGSADKMAAINIEGSWSIRRTDPPALVSAKIDRHIALYQRLHSAFGDRFKLGYFGEAPMKDYFGYQTSYFGNPASIQYPDFLKAPALVSQINSQSSRLTAAVDVLFPSLYLRWYDDAGATEAERYQRTADGWTVASERTVAMAKAWKKPVYPFIWMQYHNMLNAVDRRGKFLEAGLFGYQLETIKKMGADGVVIWGTVNANGTRATFSKNDNWWREYIAFARSNGANLQQCAYLPDPSSPNARRR